MSKALIISDGRPGHANQSKALCAHLGLQYEIIEIACRSKAAKTFSYALDRLGLYVPVLFSSFPKQLPAGYKLIISTGSTTYYASKLFARRLKIPNIAILHPKGYRLNFSHIFCPAYDRPPKRDHITELPINLCAADENFFQEKADEFLGLHQQQKKAVGIIIGGPNAVSDMDPVRMEQYLESIVETTPGMERWITTSPRTPKNIEAVIAGFEFDYRLIYSENPYNPVPAFIHLCDRLFVTSDSASMISECVSFGKADVEILMNRQLKSPNKFEQLIHELQERNALHIFDGALGNAGVKIDVGPTIHKALEPWIE